jgi:hypothetical protein
LELSGFTNQAYFLLGLGLSAHARQNSDNQETARLLPMFLMEMGSRLKVLIQHKSVENVRLAGLKFKQPLKPVHSWQLTVIAVRLKLQFDICL